MGAVVNPNRRAARLDASGPGRLGRRGQALPAPPNILPPPSRIVRTLVGHADIVAGEAVVTCGEIVGGFLVGTISGVALALVMAQSRNVEQALGPLLVVAQALPVFAIAPLLVIWFGFGFASKIVMAGLIIFFPVTTSFLRGCVAPTPAIDLAVLNRATRRATLLVIRVPAALPSLQRACASPPRSRPSGPSSANGSDRRPASAC